MSYWILGIDIFIPHNSILAPGHFQILIKDIVHGSRVKPQGIPRYSDTSIGRYSEHLNLPVHAATASGFINLDVSTGNHFTTDIHERSPDLVAS